jgi:hypothetical protein
MRKLLITLDDDLDLWLKDEVNQNDTIRKALKLYKGDISTDTLAGIRQTYQIVLSKLETHDESFKRMDKLINVIETRM